MSNSTLNNLLKEYEEKRLRANLDAEKRKEDLYSSNKRLQEIDEELHKIGFNKINSILNDSSISINDLLENINNLKIEKDKILNKLNINADYLLPKYLYVMILVLLKIIILMNCVLVLNKKFLILNIINLI